MINFMREAPVIYTRSPIPDGVWYMRIKKSGDIIYVDMASGGYREWYYILSKRHGFMSFKDMLDRTIKLRRCTSKIYAFTRLYEAIKRFLKDLTK
jgi:hypothetical protein